MREIKQFTNKYTTHLQRDIYLVEAKPLCLFTPHVQGIKTSIWSCLSICLPEMAASRRVLNPSKMVKKNVFLHTTYPALQILCFISHTYKPQILTPHMFIHIKSDAWCMLRGDILKLRRDFGSN